jgi:serine/threonine-protein kinase
MRSIAFIGLLAVTSLSEVAHAQVSAADKASAEALFNEGVALIAAGVAAEGCRKLEGSQAVEATLGTELRLADCYERLGKTASAWATFKHAQSWARQNGQADREELARQRVEALAPELSYLTLFLAGTAPPGLKVTRDGSTLPLASLGVALPIDPGEQRIEASAPDHDGWQQTLLVAPGPGTLRLQIPQLTKHLATVTPVRAAPARDESWSTERTAGAVTGATGALALLLGAGFGIYAKVEGDRSKRDEFCPNDNHTGCTPEGVDIRDRARAFGTASTVTFVVGGALLATGVTLWAATAGPATASERVAALRWRAAALPGQFSTSLGGSW